MAGGGTSGVVSISVDVAAADFPTIPVDKGGTGATDAAAARAALAVLTQAQVDARAVARFSNAEKTKLNNLRAGGAVVNLGTVTLAADRITAVAPSGYSHYPNGTLLLFRVGTVYDPSWTGGINFYIGADYYDLYKGGAGAVRYSDIPIDTTFLAVVDNAIQLLGPVDVPDDSQIAYKAFSNPPSYLTDTEKTAVRTAVDSASIADVLTQILAGTGISIDDSVTGQITLSSTVAGGSADGTLQSVVLAVGAQTITFASTIGSDIVLDVSGLLALYAPIAGATFTGATGGIAPAAASDFVTKEYADANYSSGSAPVTAHDLIAGWSDDTTITDAEITAGGTSATNSVVLPLSAGSRYMFVWRADADGGNPSELHIGAAGGNSRTLFGAAVARAVGGVAGQMLVSINTFNAGLTGGETVRVI